MKLKNKITVKEVLGKKPSAALLGDKNELPIMTVYGRARDRKPGTHTFGDGSLSEYVKFTGDFRAVRVSDGVEFRSGELILPNVASNVLDNVVLALDKEAKETVEFAFFISMEKDDSTVGFKFTAEPLVESRENDPLADMATRLAGSPGFPALEDKTEKVTDIKDAKSEPAESGQVKAPAKKAAAKK